ncbi:MAG: hypothetical protein ACM3OF_08515 [Gemmatimonas sp.]
MEQRPPIQSEVLAFAPKQKPGDGTDPIDQTGRAIVAMLGKAVSISSENVDLAMSLAHKLAMQLRSAEERITQLQSEVQRLEARAARAEQWLETIKHEIQDKLIAPMEADRPELPALH